MKNYEKAIETSNHIKKLYEQDNEEIAKRIEKLKLELKIEKENFDKNKKIIRIQKDCIKIFKIGATK